MPFDKKAQDAVEVAKGLRGVPLDEVLDTQLQLNEFTVKPSRSFGQLVNLYCQTEDGEKIKLSTFSEVVADQCEEVAAMLPLIICPKKTANYFTIF